MENISGWVDPLQDWIIEKRRQLHREPELGWLEFKTSVKIAEILTELGWEVKVGKEIIEENERYGVPTQTELSAAWEKANKERPNDSNLLSMKNGLTGVVGFLDSGLPGPVQAYRFDIDALPVNESTKKEHVPNEKGFSSKKPGVMHACGHDGHTAMGLGLAKLLSSHKDKWTGKIRLIFQPAEEGLRGAYPMVEKGVVDDVDYFTVAHIGLKAKSGELISGATRFLASTKFTVTFNGVPAHAGMEPEVGKNAMLAAATAVLGIHGISSHSKGVTRLNCGTLQAGRSMNIIADCAELTVETRSDLSEVNEYLEDRVLQVCQGAADMHGVECKVEVNGRGLACDSSESFSTVIEESAKKLNIFDTVSYGKPFNASEDATYFMDRVQKRGGQASYIVIGTQLKGSHHQPDFDYDENDLIKGVKLFFQLALDLSYKK